MVSDILPLITTRAIGPRCDRDSRVGSQIGTRRTYSTALSRRGLLACINNPRVHLTVASQASPRCLSCSVCAVTGGTTTVANRVGADGPGSPPVRHFKREASSAAAGFPYDPLRILARTATKGDSLWSCTTSATPRLFVCNSFRLMSDLTDLSL